MTSTDGLIAGAVLFLALFVYILWPEKVIVRQPDKTRLDFLEEWKEQLYANLRDLHFEYQAGKYPLEDYEQQRALLENEAATVLAEMELLQQLDQATLHTAHASR